MLAPLPPTPEIRENLAAMLVGDFDVVWHGCAFYKVTIGRNRSWTCLSGDRIWSGYVTIDGNTLTITEFFQNSADPVVYRFRMTGLQGINIDCGLPVEFKRR